MTPNQDTLAQALRTEGYFADDGLLTAIHLALVLRIPLLLEGEPGVGKTEVANVLARVLHRELMLSKVVLDAEGGTRIGHALQEFLGSTRHLTTARGALVIVLSDGLERGEPRQLRSAVHRLSMVGHRLLWWSPLACEPNYRPVTAGMAAIVEYLDGLAGVRDLETAWTQVNARFRSRRPTTFPR